MWGVGKGSEILETRAWGEGVWPSFPFRADGAITIPLSFLFLSLFSGRKSGLIGSGLKTPCPNQDSKTETDRNRR